MNIYKLSFIGLILASFIFTSCDKDDDKPSYEIPTTYEFTNVTYQGQKDRLAMMQEIKDYMKTSRTQGNVLDAQKLSNMFSNEAGAGFSQAYTKQLKSKTFENAQQDFEDLFVELAEASNSTSDGINGVSGVVKSQDGAKSYLLGGDGLDHAQIIEKGLMGACFYYQSTAVYMGDDRMNVDNDMVEPGKGTAMEHHWDEAFGYFGAPTDFPSNKDNIFFWGSYSNQRDALLNCNSDLMDQFLKGRAAISNKDLESRDEAINEIRKEWELVSVGSAIHYINSSLENFDDMALRGHLLSEAIGFIYTLQFNPTKKLSNSEINELLILIAGNEDFDSMNLYNTVKTNLDLVKLKLAQTYGLTNIADEF